MNAFIHRPKAFITLRAIAIGNISRKCFCFISEITSFNLIMARAKEMEWKKNEIEIQRHAQFEWYCPFVCVCAYVCVWMIVRVYIMNMQSDFECIVERTHIRALGITKSSNRGVFFSLHIFLSLSLSLIYWHIFRILVRHEPYRSKNAHVSYSRPLTCKRNL